MPTSPDPPDPPTTPESDTEAIGRLTRKFLAENGNPAAVSPPKSTAMSEAEIKEFWQRRSARLAAHGVAASPPGTTAPALPWEAVNAIHADLFRGAMMWLELADVRITKSGHLVVQRGNATTSVPLDPDPPSAIDADYLRKAIVMGANHLADNDPDWRDLEVSELIELAQAGGGGDMVPRASVRRLADALVAEQQRAGRYLQALTARAGRTA